MKIDCWDISMATTGLYSRSILATSICGNTERFNTIWVWMFYQIKTEPQNFQITGASGLREIEAVIGIWRKLNTRSPYSRGKVAKKKKKICIFLFHFLANFRPSPSISSCKMLLKNSCITVYSRAPI